MHCELHDSVTRCAAHNHFTNAKVHSAMGSMKFTVITIIAIKKILMLLAMLIDELRNAPCKATQLSNQTTRAMVSLPEYGPMEPPGPLPVAPGIHFPNENTQPSTALERFEILSASKSANSPQGTAIKVAMIGPV